MFTTQRLGKLIFFVCAFFSYQMTNAVIAKDNSGIEQDFKLVGQSSIDNLLADFAAATEENYAKIETLQASMDMYIEKNHTGDAVSNVLQRSNIKAAVTPEKLGVIYEATTSFKSDVKNKKNWSHTFRPNGPSYKNMDTQQLISNGHKNLGLDDRYIVTPDYEIGSHNYQVKKDGSVLEKRAFKSKRQNNQSTSWGSDHTFFYKPIGFTWKWLSALRYLRSNGTIKSDSIVIRECTSSGAYYILIFPVLNANRDVEGSIHVVLPRKTGFNPTSIKEINASGDVVLEEFTLDYKEINGVFAPLYFHSIRRDEDGSINDERIMKFRDVKVNKEIPDGTFSENNLGLKDGDKLIDQTDPENVKTFVHDKGRLCNITNSIPDNNKIAPVKRTKTKASVKGDENAKLEMLSTQPNLPAKLTLGTRLNIKISYSLPENIDKAKIWARPYLNSSRASNYRASAVSFVGKGFKSEATGVTENWFYFDEPIVIDAVRIWMSDMSNKNILTKTVPISAEWVE